MMDEKVEYLVRTRIYEHTSETREAAMRGNADVRECTRPRSTSVRENLCSDRWMPAEARPAHSFLNEYFIAF
jgi:hypothetical protein